MANKYEAESQEAQAAAKRLRMCESKVAYDTLMEAKAGWAGNVYECPHCHKFHRTGSFRRLLRNLRKAHEAKQGQDVKHED